MTKNILKSMAAAILLLCFFITSTSFTEPKEWKQFESKECRFKINFPAEVTQTSQPVKTAAGDLTLHIFQADVSSDTANNNIIYMVNYSALPDSINSTRKEKMDDFFERSINGMVRNAKGTVLSQKKVDYKSYPGREVRVDLQGQATLTVKLILIENRYYILLAITAVAKEPNTDIKKFFDSFENE
jgi:hypothetical protein